MPETMPNYLNLLIHLLLENEPMKKVQLLSIFYRWRNQEKLINLVRLYRQHVPRPQFQRRPSNSYTMKYHRKAKGNNGQIVCIDIKKNS